MKTPQQIADEYEKITDEGAQELAKFLDKWGGVPDKNFVELDKECKKDGAYPYMRVRSMLTSAYDWFAYGN